MDHGKLRGPDVWVGGYQVMLYGTEAGARLDWRVGDGENEARGKGRHAPRILRTIA